MDIHDLKKKIGEFGWGEFAEMVNEEGGYGDLPDQFEKVVGLKFEFVEGYRDYSTYGWVFKIGEKLYRTLGWYDSWNGVEMDDIHGLHEVKQVEKVIKVWEKV